MKFLSKFVPSTLCFLLILFFSLPVRSDTVLINPTQQQFADALAQGGRIILGADLDFYPSQSYVLSKNTELLSGGFNFIIHATSTFITVPSGVTLAIEGLVVPRTETSSTFFMVPQGSLQLTNCLFRDYNGTAIHTSQGAVRISQSRFRWTGYTGTAAVYNLGGTLNVEGSEFIQNYASPIVSSGPTTISNTLFMNNWYNNVVLSDATIANSLFVSNYSGMTITGNSKISGLKWLFNSTPIDNRGTLSISNAFFYNNYNRAIINSNSLALSSVTFSSNSVTGANSYVVGCNFGCKPPYGPTVAALPGRGGAILNAGECNITNSTFYMNYVRGGDWVPFIGASGTPKSGDAYGGAIYNEGNLTMAHSTALSNFVYEGTIYGPSGTPGTRSGGFIYNAGSSLILENSWANGSNGPLFGGSITDYGNNLSEDFSGHFAADGSINGAVVSHLAYGFYGGTSPVIPPAPGSIAIDTAYPPFVPSTDQRGVIRTRNSGDIGAVEFVALSGQGPVLTTAQLQPVGESDLIKLSGQNLFYTTDVQVGGASVDFTVISDSELLIISPYLVTSNSIQVHTLFGTTVTPPDLKPIGEIRNFSFTNSIITLTFHSEADSLTVVWGYTSPSTVVVTNNFHGKGNHLANIPYSYSPTGSVSLFYQYTSPNSEIDVKGSSFLFAATPYVDPQLEFSVISLVVTPAGLKADATIRSEVAVIRNLYYSRSAEALLNSPNLLSSTEGIDPVVSGVVPNPVPGATYYFRAEGVAKGTNYLGPITTSSFGPVASYTFPEPLRNDSLRFNNATQYVTIPGIQLLNSFPMSVGVWFKTTQTVGYSGLVSKYTPGTGTGYQITVVDGVLHAFYLKDSNNKIFSSPEGMSGGFVSDGNWHKAEFVVSQTGGVLYLDGVQKATGTWVGIPGPTTSSAPLNFGKYFDAYEGELDEITLWNRARNAQEAALYTSSPDLADTSLLGYWRLNQGRGMVAVDSSQHANDGNLVGDVQWGISTSPLSRRPTIGMTGTGVFQYDGTPGQTMVLEHSSNLINWTPVSTNILDNTGYNSVTITPSSQNEFFRARVQ